MKSFKNILLIALQALETQLFTFLSLRSFGYAPQKMLQFETQLLTTHFNIHS